MSDDANKPAAAADPPAEASLWAGCETRAAADGVLSAGRGWTNEVITPERGMRAVDGLLTGWHEPQASHLGLLEAALGEELRQRLGGGCGRASRQPAG